MSQKLLFFAVGIGDLNRWLGLFNSPLFFSFGRKLALVTTLFAPCIVPPADGFSLFWQSSFCRSSLTASSAPPFLDSGVKQFPPKKEGLAFLFSIGLAVGNLLGVATGFEKVQKIEGDNGLIKAKEGKECVKNQESKILNSDQSITGSEFIGGGKAVPMALAKIATDVFVSYVEILTSKKQEIGAC
ncbi:hypothetical protein NC653_029124 [Populus alba x Populus x berolinensis]|uniref:Uncharacterized protein n=1 Tax=Populus alba x Populus x berolinensis TaxID=444605 RepID=A0AAD6M2C9_9ROSI|nr:hypothetical protein NC653_029124 [Populus alba x Populus x berolinensis]